MADVSVDALSRKFDKGVSLLCWAYNEEDSIGEYLERIAALLDATVEDYEIVLIDDCSIDRTNEIAQAFQAKNPRLKIFRNEKNLNVGISSRRAIQRASKEFLFWQTIDWSYDISNLRQYLEYLKTYDIVQGTRKGADSVVSLRHLSGRSDTMRKAFVSIINYLLIRFLFRIPLSDFQNVTFYPTKWIQSVEYEARSSFANPEGLIKSYWNNKTIIEVPIPFIPRAQGEAKGTRIKAIMNSVKDVFRLWFSWIVLGRRGTIKKGRIERALHLFR